MTTTTSWLPLTEYSMKHQVSISTLRRRIKAEDIKFRFDDGKYFILDEDSMKAATQTPHRPSLSREAQKSVMTTASAAIQSKESAQTPAKPTDKPTEKPASAPATSIVTEPGESVITAANKLLTDLKKAYTQVLQDKEEQILQLREEIVDLKTLIKVLESENTRLRR